jgi:hypothetical protein
MRIDLHGPLPAGDPGRDAVAVHTTAPERRREVVNQRVRRIGLDDGVRIVVCMRFYQLLEERVNLGLFIVELILCLLRE